MKLSEIPFEHILTKEDWVTSLTGKRGRITGINCHGNGIFFSTYITIVWKDIPAPRNVSIVKWPHEASKIEVDMSMYPPFCIDFCAAQLERHTAHEQFWGTVVDGKALRNSTVIANNVQEDADNIALLKTYSLLRNQ